MSKPTDREVLAFLLSRPQWTDFLWSELDDGWQEEYLREADGILEWMRDAGYEKRIPCPPPTAACSKNNSLTPEPPRA